MMGICLHSSKQGFSFFVRKQRNSLSALVNARDHGMNVTKAMLGWIFSGLFIANWLDHMYIFIVSMEDYLVLSSWHFHNCLIYFGSKVGDLSRRQLSLVSFQEIRLEQNSGFLQNCDGRLKDKRIWTDKMKNYDWKKKILLIIAKEVNNFSGTVVSSWLISRASCLLFFLHQRLFSILSVSNAINTVNSKYLRFWTCSLLSTCCWSLKTNKFIILICAKFNIQPGSRTLVWVFSVHDRHENKGGVCLVLFL